MFDSNKQYTSYGQPTRDIPSVNRSLGNGSNLTSSDVPEDLPTDRQDLVYSQVTGPEPGLNSAREYGDQSLNFNLQDSYSNQDMLLQSQNSQNFQNALIQSQRMLELAKEETRMMVEQLSQQNGSEVGSNMPLRLPDLVNTQIQVPQSMGNTGQLQKNNNMLTSDPNSNSDIQRFVSLQMMDTISSNESKQTSEFKTFQSNDLVSIQKRLGAIDIGSFDSGTYLQHVRATSNNSDGENKLSPRDGIRGLSNLQGHPATMTNTLETDQELSAGRTTGAFPYVLSTGQQLPQPRDYQIGQRPQASTSQLEQLTQHKLQTPQAQNNAASQGKLLLATRPQNYESLSLTNSTEFGQHSLQSSVELSNGQANQILNSHNRPNVLSGQKPNISTTSNFLANQMAGRSNSKENGKQVQDEKDWKVPFHNNTILEDLKEEDVSFAYSNQNKNNNSRIQSANNSKIKIEKQCSVNKSSEAGRESAPKSDATEPTNSKTSANRKNELSYKDDELIEELARTCFKSGGFYKPSSNSHFESIETEPEADILRRSNSDAEERKEEMQHKSKLDDRLENNFGTAHTPDMNTKKMSKHANDLIKIDESQFVTLSQVQENRAIMSSGISQSPYKTSNYTETTANERPFLMTQQKINNAPSSADLVSDTENECRVQAMSQHSSVSNQLYQTSVEHTQGRLGYFQQHQVASVESMDLNTYPSNISIGKQDSQSTLEKRAQRLGMGKMVGHDGMSTSAGTIIDPHLHGISATTAKFTENNRPNFHDMRDVEAHKSQLCQGCSQPMISEFIATQRNEKTNPLPITGLKASFSDHKTMALQNELIQLQHNNSQFLMNSGRLLANSQHGSSSVNTADNLLSSYQHVLCSECASKQLQSSEGVQSTYSGLGGLRVSQLLNNFNQVSNPVQPQKINLDASDQRKQFSSYQRFTEGRDENIGQEDSKTMDNRQPPHGNLMTFNAHSSQSVGMNENNSLQSNSELKPTSMLGGQQLRLDTDSVSSLDSRLMPNHLVWSQHKGLQPLSTKSCEKQALLESAVRDDINGISSGLKASDSEQALKKMSLLDSKSNANSLQFLSYLSSTANQQAKQQQLDTEYKYANQHLLSSGASNQTGKYSNGDYATSNYKIALRNFMDRQIERSVRQPIGGSDSKSGAIPMSRIFRERQSRRMFDDLQNLKGSCAKTYEELEQMHAQVLLSKTASSRQM